MKYDSKVDRDYILTDLPLGESAQQNQRLRKKVSKVEHLLKEAEKHHDRKEYYQLQDAAFLMLREDRDFARFHELLREEFNPIVVLEAAKAEIGDDELNVGKRDDLLNDVIAKIAWPTIAAVVIATLTGFITAIYQIKSQKQIKVFQADYDRATKILEELADIHMQMSELQWEMGYDEVNGQMHAMKAKSYADKVRFFETKLIRKTNGIDYAGAHGSGLAYAQSALEVRKLWFCLDATYKGSNKAEWERVNRSFDRYIDQFQSAELLDKGESELIKEGSNVQQPCWKDFDPTALAELIEATSALFFDDLESSIFNKN